MKGTITDKCVDSNWDALQKPGLNGVVSLLAALFYWGMVAQKNTKHCEVWVAHVEECIVILRQLTALWLCQADPDHRSIACRSHTF